MKNEPRPHPWRSFVPGQLQHKPKPIKGAMEPVHPLQALVRDPDGLALPILEQIKAVVDRMVQEAKE